MFYGSFTRFSAAQTVEHGTNNAKVMGSISRERENR